MINNQKRNNYSKQEKGTYSFAISIEYPELQKQDKNTNSKFNNFYIYKYSNMKDV